MSQINEMVTEAGAVFAAGAATAELHETEVEGLRVAVLPGESEWQAELVDVGPYLLHPRRKQGTVVARTVESFVRYVTRHKTEETVAFANDNGVVVAVLNHHEPAEVGGDGEDIGNPGWGDHRAVLQRPQTTAFKAWTGANGKQLSQLQFAEFLEDRMREVVHPDGATLFEVAKFFQASQSVSFSSARRLDNGEVQLHYVEDLEGKTGAGNETVPTDFIVRLQPYRDSESFDIGARLRWRLYDQKVQFTFHLDELVEEHLERIHEDAIEEIEGAAAVPVIRGTLS